MNIKGLAACSLLAVLAGCASNSAPSTGTETVVHVSSQVGNEMIARRLDAVPAEDLQKFTFTGADHTMELGIVMAGHRDNYRRCVATISYAHFKPGTHYTLTQTDVVNGGVAVALMGADGQTLMRAENIPCV